MCPELFHIGPIPIRSFGVMMALSFLLGVLYVQRIAKRDGKPFEPYFMIAYIMIIGGVVGARLAYVLLHLDEFTGHWTRTFNPFAEGQFGIAGLNLYGGVLLALIGTFAYCRWKRISVLDAFDYFAPTLALGIGITVSVAFSTVAASVRQPICPGASSSRLDPSRHSFSATPIFTRRRFTHRCTVLGCFSSCIG